MIAIISNAGIRLIGVGTFVATNRQGTLEAILDRLGAQPDQNGKRLMMNDSIDEAIVRYSVPTEQAVKILEASGIQTKLSEAA